MKTKTTSMALDSNYAYLASSSSNRCKFDENHVIEPTSITHRMNRFYKISLLFLFSVLLVPFSAKASHVAGVDITWTCLGNDTYEIFLSIYRDCNGISLLNGNPPYLQTVDFTNNCGFPSQTVDLSYVTPTVPTTPSGGINIAQLCQPDSLLSTCFNGSFPGMEQYVFSGIVTLAPPCNSWTVAWDLCCRNAAIQNLQNPGAADMYAEANLYTQSDSCNNSPVFSAQPIPYVCANQPVFYNYGVYDPDGDSLYFSLISARETATTLIPYVTPTYSPTQPFPGLTLDSNTGEIAFTPTTTGNFVIVILVQEFDDVTGALIGEVMRDMQFTVIPCTNTNPALPAAASNASGTASPTGPFSFDMCVGTNLSFDLTFTDPDPLDTLTLTSNVLSVLPGATFTTSGINPITASVTWTAVGNTASVVPFTFEVKDNACPIAGISIQTVVITIVPSVYAGTDITICDGNPVVLNASGGTSFNWQAISGPPINVGVNFSCDTCMNPIASPASSTVYLLTSNLNSLCVNQDTISVTVTPPFDFAAIQPTDVTCNGVGDGQIALGNPSGSAPAPYTWQLFDVANVQVDSATVNGAHTFTGLLPGTYSVRLTEANGCSKDSSGFVINEPAPMAIVVGDTLICQTSVATLSASASGGNGTYTYSWAGFSGSGPHFVSPADSTYYTVFATDQLGCTSPLDSFLVAMHPVLDVTPTWTDSVCIGEMASFNAAGAGGNGGPYLFDWIQVGIGSIGNGTSITTTPSQQNTAYTVTISDNCGSPSVTMNLPVSWHTPPSPIISPDAFENCFPASFNFSNQTDPSFVGSTCVWDFGDGNVSSGGCGTINHVYQNVGCYDVNLTVYSPDGCPGDSTFSQIVCARPYPDAQFSFGPQPTNIYNPEISFFNESTDAVSYVWEFGDNASLGTTAATDPVFIFPDVDQGSYPAWLYATNIYGCVDSIMYMVDIDGVFAFWVPNAFTPDGDGINSEFRVMGEGISNANFIFQIYNRWGEVVWQTTDPNLAWDGSGAQEGVYVYRVELQDRYSLVRKEYFGHVSLLR